MEIGEYKLTPEQEAGVIHLLELKHAVLGFKPGKGKTLPAIYAAKEFCGGYKKLSYNISKTNHREYVESRYSTLKHFTPKDSVYKHRAYER